MNYLKFKLKSYTELHEIIVKAVDLKSEEGEDLVNYIDALTNKLKDYQLVFDIMESKNDKINNL